MSDPASASLPAPDGAGADLAGLVSSHREFLAFVERRVGSREVAEDILQEAFVRAVGAASALRRGESLRAWFYRVLRNAITDHYRRKGTSGRAQEALLAELEAAEAPPEWEEAACRCVLGLLPRLKPEYAEALARIEIDGAAVSTYAEERGISPNNAGVRVFRARRALARLVTLSCRTCAAHGCLDCTCGGKAGAS